MIKPRTQTPELKINLVNGTKWDLNEQSPENFTMIVVYRGKHCPVCKKQLSELQKQLNDFIDKGVNVLAISSDTKEKAQATYEDWNIADIPLGYGFTIEDARKWGLYISKGIKEEPDQFIEPGLFLIRPDGTLYSAYIQSLPFARPQWDDVLKGLEFVIKEDYPARGEA